MKLKKSCFLLFFFSTLANAHVIPFAFFRVQAPSGPPPVVNMCDTLTSSSSATGTLYDSGGPSAQYSNNENCTFTINTSGVFELDFSSFNYENGYDYLEIRDASSNALHESLSGNISPGPFSYSAPVRIISLTDFTVTRSGFAMTWGPYVPDYTPNAINWADFNNSSSQEAFTGINTSINVEVSAVNGVGTPTLQYKRNSDSPVSFTTSSPATVSISPNDTLSFIVSGTVGHTATFTIRNLSDSNTLLDTTVGTITPCSGASHAGYCWFLGNADDSCDTTCANQGLSCDIAGTRDYAGSGGSDAQCFAVMDALSAPNGSGSWSISDAVGCGVNGSVRDRETSSATTCTARTSFGLNVERACACN